MQQPIFTPLRAAEVPRTFHAPVSTRFTGFVKCATAFGIGHSVILAGIVTAAVWLLSWIFSRTRPL